AGPARKPVQEGRLSGREDRDAEEAELSASQGGPRAIDQRDGSHSLYPRNRPQPAGALGGDDPRGPNQGPAGRSISYRERHVGYGRNERPQVQPKQIRN